MDTAPLVTKFARLGARFRVVREANPWTAFRFTLDVRPARRGESFELTLGSKFPGEFAVLDVQPAERHLLLMVREGGAKAKYLCGHDERHWFVAGIPETAAVGTVRQAKESLKPPAVRDAESRLHLPTAQRDRRKNAAFLRQGEWFFLPAPGVVIDARLVLTHEPLVRATGRGKPHVLEFCYRVGGETVYVGPGHPAGVTEAVYRQLLTRPRASKSAWRAMRRNPALYARGHVRHADHATITLPGWHQVVMNTEGESRAMRNVAFLD